jgi:hypothetical protein
MRQLFALAAVLGLTLLAASSADAGSYYCDGRQLPNHHMNYHCPYYIPTCAYWHPGPYGIWGPTDPSNRPVNGMPAPAYCPKICNPQLYAPTWHRYMRSPRDFFMLQY